MIPPEIYREVYGPQSFECPVCKDACREEDGYQSGAVTLCPACFNSLPAALMELVEQGGKVIARIDAWSPEKQAADDWASDHGIAVTHSISDEAAKQLEAEIPAQSVGAQLWEIFSKN